MRSLWELALTQVCVGQVSVCSRVVEVQASDDDDVDGDDDNDDNDNDSDEGDDADDANDNKKPFPAPPKQRPDLKNPHIYIGHNWENGEIFDSKHPSLGFLKTTKKRLEVDPPERRLVVWVDESGRWAVARKTISQEASLQASHDMKSIAAGSLSARLHLSWMVW